MIDPKEMFSAFQPEQFLKTLQSQYGWGEKEVQQAFEALLPAVWAGIRHTSSTPDGLAQMMTALTQSANPLAGSMGAAGAMQPTMFAPWVDVSQKMFSSPDLQQAIARQVADSTGLGQDALKAVMPTMTVLATGGLMRQFAFGPARTMLDSFMAGYARGRPAPASTPMDFMAPYTEAMSTFFDAFTGVGNQKTSPAPEKPAKSKSAKSSSMSASKKEKDDTKSDDAKALESLMPFNLDEVMKAGMAMQENQIKSFENLFSQFTPRGD
ncbi:MAG: DUF937 domain-containing protein [Stappiaceae bacterium]